MSKKTNDFMIRAAAFGLAAAGMMTGFTGCDKDKKNTEPSKESKESVVTTVDMPSKTEPVVITTEPVVTESTEIVATEPVVETTEAAVDYIDLNNVRLIAISLDTGNYYYTMKLEKLDTNDVSLYHIIHICDDYDYYYYDVTDLEDVPYKTVNEYYTGIGLSEGCSGFEYTTYDMNGPRPYNGVN